MSKSSHRIWAVALSAIILALGAIALSTYYMARDTLATPTNTTLINLGQIFTWHVGEVVDVQGHLYT